MNKPNIKQTLETIIDELQYALTTGDDTNREFYIKNAIRFAQEAIDPIPLPTIKPGDKVKYKRNSEYGVGEVRGIDAFVKFESLSFTTRVSPDDLEVIPNE